MAQNQTRVAKVLAALLVSMTTGAIILMALGNNPPSAGPFCLSSYYRLDPIEKAVHSQAAQSPDRWGSIEIYYSDTRYWIPDTGYSSSVENRESRIENNCHFVICNGLGGEDGYIQPTAKWQKQWSIVPGKNWFGNGQTIRICLIADGTTSPPTDSQVKRIESLVESLCSKFHIRSQSIYYPSDWR
jgi:hypothetical protein